MTGSDDRATPTPCGCGCGSGGEGTRALPIVWQRLVVDGATCPRCGSTGSEVERAVAMLTDALRPLGIEPVLEVRALDQPAFDAAPSESNRIFIGGRALEDWLGATVGSSQCCSVCGTNPCRSLDVEGTTYESIPAGVIVKAGLLAAAALVEA